MTKDFISIIIPVFNREDLISETLNSILNQEFLLWECIIVDDGSDDNTLSIIEKYTNNDTRIKLYKRPASRKKGANACRNLGFEYSCGEYICWFDSDDIMKPSYLKILYDKIKLNVDVVVCDSEVIGANEDNMSSISNTDNIVKDLILQNIRIETPKCLWKKSFLSQVKLFDENLQRIQDWEFNIRTFSRTKKIGLIDLRLYSYRRHENSITLSDLNNKPYELLISYKAAIRSNLDYFLKNDLVLDKLLDGAMSQISLLLELKQYKRALKFINYLFVICIYKPFFFRKWFRSILGLLSYLFFRRGNRLFKPLLTLSTIINK